jgi:hypothetical protein
VKLAEEPYAKPHFPPSLEWYELSRGPDHAGELLATFELLEVRFVCHLNILWTLHGKGRYQSMSIMKIEIKIMNWTLSSLN